jgi:hypothetical protein
MNMPGIEFLRDRKGRQKAVLIDLKKHKRLWEDLYDAYLAHSRRGERIFARGGVGSAADRR